MEGFTSRIFMFLCVTYVSGFQQPWQITASQLRDDAELEKEKLQRKREEKAQEDARHQKMIEEQLERRRAKRRAKLAAQKKKA